MNTEGKQKPGDNPNTLNAKPRQNVRPRVKNSTGNSTQSMRLGWIDPLPVVDAIYPLGIEPNVEAIPAGEIDLDFYLPETIGQPFADTVLSVGDRIQLSTSEKDDVSSAISALSFFKGARQLYSTMLDYEKAENQPLKAVYYDETPIPSHMAGALGVIGHMDTKVGKVLVRDAGVLFKRWTAEGLKRAHENDENTPYVADSSNLVWDDRDSFKMVQRLARERISHLVKQTYTLDVNGTAHVVSMPQLIDQDLQTYYNQITNQVPDADHIRHLVTGLIATRAQFKQGDLPNNIHRADLLGSLGLVYATGVYEIPQMRESFEEWIALYTTTQRWHVEAFFNVGPPPAGTSGYGAQTVSTEGNTARWQFPLSDADVNIGYLFSPCRGFTLTPKMIGYSRRRGDDARSAFALSDAKKFVTG